MIRNLLYNCCAIAANDEWRMNVAHLCEYPGAFNGRRVVLVKTGEGLVDPDLVESAFAPLGTCEFVRLENDRRLQEFVGFGLGLTMLQSLREDEATFYAHTKGVKYTKAKPWIIAAVRQWRDKMYEHCLSRPDVIERVLRTHAATGCFLQGGPAKPLPSTAQWHFAGTFFWLKHSTLFGLPDWADVHEGPYGIEAYPGMKLPYESAHCLLDYNGDGGLYAVHSVFLCGNCGNEFDDYTSVHKHPRRTCPKCHKRRGEFLRPVQRDRFASASVHLPEAPEGGQQQRPAGAG